MFAPLAELPDVIPSDTPAAIELLQKIAAKFSVFVSPNNYLPENHI